MKKNVTTTNDEQFEDGADKQATGRSPI